MDERPVRIGVSACLLGQEVRWDGGHKRAAHLADGLGGRVEWVPVCPEVELGMGVPRPRLRLVRGPEGTRMLEVESGLDHTERMRAFARRRVEELAGLALSGFVLKARSPSCGARDGPGLFAQALLEALPDLPVAEAEELRDPAVRDRFIENVFSYRRER